MGPLEGIKVLEIAGIGPGPFCGLMLADMGADVVRLDRPEHRQAQGREVRLIDLSNRSRRSVAIDLKHSDGVALTLRLVEQVDVLFEGFRPGVMERLGLGPDVCLERNPRLVYGRMTGWGQDGPLAQAAGHDINYISLTGALHAIGPADQPPSPPLNLVGDFGGGGMFLAYGIACALIERQRSGKGQVVDAAIVDGTSLLMTSPFNQLNSPGYVDQRGTQLVGGNSPYYRAYETADGKYISLGSIETQFYAQMLELAGVSGPDLPDQNDREHWPEIQAKLTAVFKTKTRDEWSALMEGSDACFAPVLSMREATQHPHNRARGTFVEVEGAVQPAPGPRFSRTPAATPTRPATPGEHTDETLRDFGVSQAEIDRLHAAGAISQRAPA